MNVLDLFSGIGGFSLGLERAGMRTIAFCEVNQFCQAILAKHWPGVPIFGDIRFLSGNEKGRVVYWGGPAREFRDIGPIDVICGGFPCQDISLAGEGAGIDGERSGLWREYARLVGELRPRYVIVENVAALLGRGIGRVLGDLASLGYDAEWHCIPASAVGLPHTRDRVWIVANHWGEREQGKPTPSLQGLYGIPWGENERRAADWRGRPNLHAPYLCGRGDGISERLDALGNAVVPQIPEIIGRAIIEAQVSA